MASSLFERTRGWLARDGFGMPGVIMTLVGLLVAGWGAWFFFVPIPIYEVAPRSRIEVAEAAHRIEAPVGGKVIGVSTTMGTAVKAGEVLIELDSAAERMEVDEERATLASRTAQVEPMRRELAAAEAALATARSALPVAVAEARARHKASRTEAAYDREQASRFEEMERAGAASDFERREAVSRAAKSSQGSLAARLQAQNLELSEKARLGAQEVDLERLRRELAGLEGDVQAIAARVKRLEFEIERRHIRAPVDGTIGEIKTLRVGDVVQEGEHLATLVPAGHLIVVAEFDPKVVGRIREGQSAEMRATGFPSTQYGTLHARVRHVASEIRDGVLRVEMSLDDLSRSTIPVEHGLPGTVEVEVERVTPAVLVLRSVGRALEPGGESSPSGVRPAGPPK